VRAALLDERFQHRPLRVGQNRQLVLICHHRI